MADGWPPRSRDESIGVSLGRITGVLRLPFSILPRFLLPPGDLSTSRVLDHGRSPSPGLPFEYAPHAQPTTAEKRTFSSYPHPFRLCILHPVEHLNRRTDTHSICPQAGFCKFHLV